MTSKLRDLLHSRNALSTEIANRLSKWIREKHKTPGTVLGTEAMLAAQFKVSRTVIREAIGQLRGLGIVESRQGLGLCVTNGDAINKIEKILAPIAGDKESWNRLCHLRFVLEIGSIPLAIELATDEQIERMRQLAEEMQELFSSTQPITREIEEKIAQLEVEFHQIIFNAAGCEFTEQFHAILVEYFNESSLDGHHRTLPTSKDMTDHMKLVEALAQRDSGKSITIMVNHIRNTLSDAFHEESEEQFDEKVIIP